MTDPVVSDSSSPALRVLAILLAVVVVLLVAAGAIALLSSGGDDGPDRVEAADESAPASPAADDEFDDFSDDFSDTFSDEPDGEPSASSAPTTSVPEAVAVDLLRTDPRPAIDDWEAAAGRNASTVEVLLYPDYAFLEVRDPDRRQQTLDYGWRDGEMEGPEPATPFPGTDLDAETFALSSVAWNALPRLVAGAPARAGIPRGEVTHVIVHSDAPFSPRFLFRIYVSAPNGASDYVVATLNGRPADR